MEQKIAFTIKIKESLKKDLKKCAIDFNMTLGDFIEFMFVGMAKEFTEDSLDNYLEWHEENVKTKKQSKDGDSKQMAEVKECSKCKNVFVLDSNNFYVSCKTDSKISYRSSCITCFNMARNKNRQKTNIKEQTLDKAENETRVCRVCGNNFVLNSESFHKDKKCKSGFRYSCKQCISKYGKTKREKKLKFNEVMKDIREEQTNDNEK